jgi:hypothetical protein
MSRKLQIKNAAIVYQGGIANVFNMGEADVLRIQRLLQADFHTCESYIRGLIAAGTSVRVYSCNKAGDIANAQWTHGLADCPFRESTKAIETID